jgi:hypothetical protein
MIPNFSVILVGGVLFALPVLWYVWWRFGVADALTFALLSGGFSAIMDFISSFAVDNYVYPGQTQLWVFTFIFFGWIGMCGSCLFVAEGILAHRNEDMLTGARLGWQVPLLTATIAVVLDLFIDPVAVAAGYWVWAVEGTVYYGIPLLNYVGWFVLMLLAPLVWIPIARRRSWGSGRKGAVALAAIPLLMVASVVLSLLLNGIIARLGVA